MTLRVTFIESGCPLRQPEMDARTAGLLVGGLSLCCLGLVLAAVYPFAVTEPHSTNPAEEQFTVGEADSFRATGRIVVDGAVVLEFEGFVTADGERYQHVEEDGLRTEMYQATPNGTVHERLTVASDGEADRLRSHLVADDDRELLREERAGGEVAFVVERDSADIASAVTGTAMVFVRSLAVAGYERRAGDTGAVDVYEPQNGWYGGDDPYRLTGASGAVRTEPDTLAVDSANVSWAVTAPAGSYAEYVLVAHTSPDPTTYTITFEFDAVDPRLDRPAWVDEPDADP